MSFYDAQTQLPALAGALAGHDNLVVTCYCAAWCDTCSEYRPSFETLAAQMPELLFVWVDIEENEALLGDEDIENFPTVLVQSPAGNLFFGPMPPHIEHLQRLLQSTATGLAVMDAGPAAMKQLVAAATK